MWNEGAAFDDLLDDGVGDRIFEVDSLKIVAESPCVDQASPFWIRSAVTVGLLVLGGKDSTRVGKEKEQLEVLWVMLWEANNSILGLLPAATEGCLNEAGFLTGKSLMERERRWILLGSD